MSRFAGIVSREGSPSVDSPRSWWIAAGTWEQATTRVSSSSRLRRRWCVIARRRGRGRVGSRDRYRRARTPGRPRRPALLPPAVPDPPPGTRPRVVW